MRQTWQMWCIWQMQWVWWMQWTCVDSDAFDAVDLVGCGLDGLGGLWTQREQPRGAWGYGNGPWVVFSQIASNENGFF